MAKKQKRFEVALCGNPIKKENNLRKSGAIIDNQLILKARW